MGSAKFLDAAIEQRLMDLHCGYIGRVIWTDGVTATVQPLGLMKEIGSASTKTQAVVKNVPVACRYKFEIKTLTYIKSVSFDGTNVQATKGYEDITVAHEIAKGDLVACLCSDRDITEARRGNNVLPPAGRHSISDSIIVGILEIGDGDA